jgi:hypothetical protein
MPPARTDPARQQPARIRHLAHLHARAIPFAHIRFRSGRRDVPTATDDTLLHLGYEALTPLELDLPFALKIFTLIQSNEFLALLNLANTPENFAKVVRTAIVVGDFLIRNPHIHYHAWPAFNGVTGVDRAVQIVATGSTGGP